MSLHNRYPIRPPWTNEEVESINLHQVYGESVFCPVDHGCLVATRLAMVCGSCRYQQHWAWAYMLGPVWESL